MEVSDRERFDKALATMQSQSCEACFPNIFMYREPYGLEFVEIKDRLVIYERVARVIHYPIGEQTPPELLYQISKAFVDAGLSDGGIYDVPESFLDDYPDCDQFFELEYDEGANQLSLQYSRSNFHRQQRAEHAGERRYQHRFSCVYHCPSVCLVLRGWLRFVFEYLPRSKG